MATYKRLSMNTSLRNANIFQDICDDAVDEIIKQFPAKTPSPDKQKLEQSQPPCKIKIEPNTESKSKLAMEEPENALEVAKMKLRSLKEKKLVPIVPTSNIKVEMDYCWNVKREVVEDDSIQEVQKEVLLKCSNIKQEIPDMEDVSKDSCNSPILKSTKKSVFARLSPYQKPTPESPRATEKVDQCVRKLSLRSRAPIEQETDPAVLVRRQKQIDYGKNTIGYDNYIRAVPRNKRTRTDPSTPDKYRKYSRRGFDSLIKHWRLHLHNYD